MKAPVDVEEKRFEHGRQMSVHRAALELEYGGKPKIDGFVFKKIDFPDVPNAKELIEKELDSMLEKWEKIRQVKTQLNKTGKEGFNIPGTVRGIKDFTGVGIGLLETDLTAGGKNKVIDLKYFKFENDVSLEQWQGVRRQIERDIEIAAAEFIDLGDSPSILDPWLIVYDPKEKSYTAYIADVGRYVHVYSDTERSRFLLERSKRELIETLNKCEDSIKERHDPA